jgi:tight adherence protein B
MTLLVLAASVAVLLWPSRPTAAMSTGTRRSLGLDGASADGHATGLRTWLERLRLDGPFGRRRAGAGLDELADLLEVLVPPLRAGTSVGAAVEVAGRAVGAGGPSDEGSRLGDLVSDLSAAASAGRSLAEVWNDAASASRSADVQFVARSWTLSEQAGVPLSVALATAARSVRARQAAEQALHAATAGARTSMGLLALLPASGPVVGLLFGLTPVDLYGRSTVSVLCLLAGGALGMTGWLWSRAILRRALRPGAVAAQRVTS